MNEWMDGDGVMDIWTDEKVTGHIGMGGWIDEGGKEMKKGSMEW